MMKNSKRIGLKIIIYREYILHFYCQFLYEMNINNHVTHVYQSNTTS